MMGEMATGESQGADVVKAVGAVVALLAGSVAFLYVAGGGALTLRLFLKGLPSLNVVAQLPREMLISVALIQIVLPMVAAAGLYALVRLLLGRTAPLPRTFVGGWEERSWRSWRARIGASAVLALAATLVGASPAFARGEHTWRIGWVLAIALLLNVVVMLVALKLRAEVASRVKDDWHSLSAGASMTLIVALAALPPSFLFAGTFRLLDAKVCTTNHSARIGLLVGETSDRVYLGETSENRWQETDEDPLRVVSIPQSDVEEISIGSKPETPGC
jgi:hypothetical protein